MTIKARKSDFVCLQIPQKRNIFMSSQQPFTAVPVVGEVQHVSHLSDHLGKLYLSEEYSDVLLVLDDNKTIPAHKVTDNKLCES